MINHTTVAAEIAEFSNGFTTDAFDGETVNVMVVWNVDAAEVAMQIDVVAAFLKSRGYRTRKSGHGVFKSVKVRR